MATRRCAGVGRGRGVHSKDAATACCETLGVDPRYIMGAAHDDEGNERG